MTRIDLLAVPADYVDLSEQSSAPATPAAGKARLYIADDLTLRWVDDEGTVREAGEGSGGSGFWEDDAVAGSGGSSTLTVDSIPGGYSVLEIWLWGRSTAAAGSRIRFNNDSGSNYDAQEFYREGGSVVGGSTFANNAIIGIPAFGTSGTAASQFQATVPFYADTAWDKALSIVGATKLGTGSTDLRSYSSAGFWRNTAAITRVDVFLSSGSFSEGSRLLVRAS